MWLAFLGGLLVGLLLYPLWGELLRQLVLLLIQRRMARRLDVLEARAQTYLLSQTAAVLRPTEVAPSPLPVNPRLN